MEKVKRTHLEEFSLYDNLNSEDEAHPIRKKAKRSEKENMPRKDPPVSWNTEEEDEVVCTPDLSGIIGNDESSPNSTDLTNSKPIKPTILPNVMTSTPFIRVKSFAQQRLNFPHTEPPPLAFRLPILAPLQCIRPATFILSPPVSNVPIANKITLDTTNQSPSDWFQTATQETAKINSSLTTKLVALAEEKKKTTNVEQMANIHNKLQELLSASVNSLIQVRKKLRTNFMQDIQNFKMNVSSGAKNNKPVTAVRSDIVKVARSEKSTILHAQLTRDIHESNADAECIVIDDDSSENGDESITESEVNSAEEQNPAENECIPTGCDQETAFLIKQALIESKFEYIVSKNMDIEVDGIPKDELKEMLSVRVCLELDYSSGTPASNPKKNFRAMVFEKTSSATELNNDELKSEDNHAVVVADSNTIQGEYANEDVYSQSDCNIHLVLNCDTGEPENDTNGSDTNHIFNIATV